MRGEGPRHPPKVRVGLTRKGVGRKGPHGRYHLDVSKHVYFIKGPPPSKGLGHLTARGTPSRDANQHDL